MELGKQITIALLAAVLLSALALGCGSNSSDSSESSSSSGSSSSAESTTKASDTTSEAETGNEGEATGGKASAEFLSPKGKNQIAKFGQEADVEEREAASSALEESLQARAGGDWATQCETLSATGIKNVEGSVAANGAGPSCAKQLEAQAQPLSETKEIRANTMTGPIAVLRVKGNKGFALYHGAKGLDYAMPMTKEGDEWKVNALVTQEVP
jgi:hypothetical protein